MAEAAEQALEGFGGREQARWLARLDAEVGNLRAALSWFQEQGQSANLLRTVAVLDVYWITGPHFAEGLRWLEAGLAGDAPVPAEIRGAALSLFVWATCAFGDHEIGLARAEEELALAQRLRLPFALGRAHYDLGMVWEHAGDDARAAAYYAESVPLFREAEAASWIYLALGDLGNARHLAGDVASAVPLLDEALALVRQVDECDPHALEDRYSLTLILIQCAYAARSQGDHALAANLFAESLAVGRELGGKRLILGAVAGLAGVALAMNQPERGARLLGAALAGREAAGLGKITQARHAERLAAEARTLLGTRAFEAAWESGRALALDDAIAEALAVASVAAGEAVPRDAHRDPFGLTPRERDVLRLLVAGTTDREIADELFISRRTVTTHTSSIFAKLGVEGRTEAAALAVRRGLA